MAPSVRASKWTAVSREWHYPVLNGVPLHVFILYLVKTHRIPVWRYGYIKKFSLHYFPFMASGDPNEKELQHVIVKETKPGKAFLFPEAYPF
jgi:hypothetical protein